MEHYRGHTIKRTIMAALVVVAIIGPAWAAVEQPYYCTIERVEEKDSDGVMKETEWAKRLHQDVRAFIYDEAIGDLRYEGFNIARRMRIVQKGTAENDAIGRIGGANIFKISTSIGGMPFAYHDDTILYTGSCQKM